TAMPVPSPSAAAMARPSSVATTWPSRSRTQELARTAEPTPPPTELRLALPPVVRRVPLFHRDEHPPARRRHHAPRTERRLDDRLLPLDGPRLPPQLDRLIHRRRLAQLDVELRRHRARRGLRPHSPHQVVRRRPVTVAIEQRADDPAVQNA